MKKLDEWKLATLKQNLPDYAEKHLTHSKGNFFCCPACGSGTKNKMTGALGLFEKGGTPLFKCQSCGATGSVIDLIMINEGKDLPSAIKRLRELYDPSYDPYEDERTNAMTTTTTPAAKTQASRTEPVKPAVKKQDTVIVRDFRNYFKKCQKNISETSYPNQRGLTDETVRRFKLGYDPKYISPTGEVTHKKKNEERERQGLPTYPLTPSPVLIIPVDANHYTARDTRPDEEIPEWQKPHRKTKEGTEGPLFNKKAMKNPLCFFVVEGEIDAMSIEQAGGSCVALRSAGLKKQFCGELQKRDAVKTGTVIIALDNDKAGKEAGDYIEKFCKDHGFLFIRQNVAGQYKDANEYLVNDRKGFYATVKGIIEGIRKESVEDYTEALSGASAFKNFMFTPAKEGFTIPTGFKKLDEYLDGGLHPGLYILGAISSIGKTTFALQMAETIATDRKIKIQKGNEIIEKDVPAMDVLFFSLEQSREDLVSKSLSRRTYEKSVSLGKKEKLAKTNMSVLRKENWTKWTKDEWDNFYACGHEYETTTGKHLFIIEAVGDYGIEEITRDVENHIAVFGRKPVVVIDYLQIMKPYEEHMADKQNIDRTTSALKRLSRDNDIPVLAISSFNRESYWNQVSITSFKESGSIEYSSDVLLALSPVGVVDAKTDSEKKDNRDTIQKTKVAKIRDIELHILKNRNGRITNSQDKLTFDYSAMFNHFKEKEYSYLSNFDNGNPATKGKIF